MNSVVADQRGALRKHAANEIAEAIQANTEVLIPPGVLQRGGDTPARERRTQCAGKMIK